MKGEVLTNLAPNLSVSQAVPGASRLRIPTQRLPTCVNINILLLIRLLCEDSQDPKVVCPKRLSTKHTRETEALPTSKVSTRGRRKRPKQ